MAKILLVEDNAHNRTVFETALRQRGFELVIAEDGARALELVATTEPDLVLLDLSLPKVDGWTVARRIRADSNPRVASLPIVALTAHAMKGDRERALAAGCNEYVSKPVSPRQLARTVEALVRAA